MDKNTKKTEVYSIRITKGQKELLRNNEWIKKELDKFLLEYLESFTEEEQIQELKSVS